MQERAFNSISIHYRENSLTKTSIQTSKLQDEINYYLNLPERIAHFFPRLIDYKKDFSSYTLEYVPYKSLSDLILANEINIEEGENVLSRLCEVLDDIHLIKPASCISPKELQNFYITKTLERIEFLDKIPFLYKLVNLPQIYINHKPYQTFQTLKASFISAIQNFVLAQSTTTMIHGDFCFSNILYCPETKDIKLIDPRGSFGSQGIYGDPDYDYAKLLHCLHGCYDYIVSNKYELQESNQGCFSFSWPTSPLLKRLHKHYRPLLRARGICLDFCYLIEASLFLSMTALHYESRQRQKALFLMGLIILNNFFEGNYENLH